MKHTAYRKVMKVIYSCKTARHFHGAKRMIGHFETKYGNSSLLESLHSNYNIKREQYGI